MDIQVLASGSGGNCYRISDGATTLLLDAGISIKQIREGCGFSLSRVSGCLITHSHGDHVKAVRDLLKFSVPVYMPGGEADALGLSHHRLHRLRRGDASGDSYAPFTVGTFTVQPFRTQHDTPEPVGYLIATGVSNDRLLYFTDTFYLRLQFVYITHVIGECNYDRDELWRKYDFGDTNASRAQRLFGTHMSLDTFLEFLRSIGHPETIQQIWICHMSDDHGNAEKTLDAVRRLTGAEVYIC